MDSRADASWNNFSAFLAALKCLIAGCTVPTEREHPLASATDQNVYRGNRG